MVVGGRCAIEEREMFCYICDGNRSAFFGMYSFVQPQGQ